MPYVSASRPSSFSRWVEPPPRPPNRSSRTASCRGRSPVPLLQRAGGLRCSRLHSGVCSHSPPCCQCGAVCRISHSSRDIVLGFRFSIAPHLLGGAAFPAALFDALPDAVGLARLCGSVAPASRCNIARQAPVMSRAGWERQALNSIQSGMGHTDPKLASHLAGFSRLARFSSRQCGCSASSVAWLLVRLSSS